ncbi:hypothetical protein F5Y04DRAFT_291893 [Hypomontagnella monticulosa]|nr:hypothetical protein F5Y04DRAFT_291893 [Hypomontagnella monticulosa]
MESSPEVNLRPSRSAPSLKAVGDRPASFRSTGPRGGSQHHKLLLNFHSTDQYSKDPPIAPVLTTDLPESIAGNIPLKHQSSDIPDQTRKLSDANPMEQGQETPFIDGGRRRPGVVCIDPTMHPPGTHATIHHPGLIMGADFCDAGFAVDRESPIRTPPSRQSPTDPMDEILTGRVYRILSGGDICEDVVDVSDHIHKDHTSAVKIRPAPGLLPRYESHEGHPSISKVQSVPGDVGNYTIIHQSDTPAEAKFAQEEPYVHEYSHRGHGPTPKVESSTHQTYPRGSENSAYPKDIHEGHVCVPKVQPYHESSPFTSKVEGNSIPRLDVKKSIHKNEDSSKEAPYWGFLPALGGKRGERTPEGLHKASSDSRDMSVIVTRVGTRPSLSASQYSASQKSAGNQENVRHDSESMVSPGKPFDTSPSQERFALQDKGKEREPSTSSVSPTSRSHPVDSESDNPEQGPLSEGFDPWRAATWLRQLLGYGEPNIPSFTQLPDKSHPRHEDHYDYPKDEVDALTSRVTTFSGENAADIGTMDTAVHNLERLLSEALFLANEVTEQDHCGHVDAQGDKGPVGPLDINDNIGMSTSVNVHEREEEPGAVFQGASKKYRPMTPDMRSGNIRRSTYPARGSSLRGIRKRKQKHAAAHEERHNASDNESILPMPPPDKRLKRRVLSPAYEEDEPGIIRPRTKDVPNSREVREYIRIFHQPPITPRSSSMNLREATQQGVTKPRHGGKYSEIRCRDVDAYSFEGTSDDIIDFTTQYSQGEGQGGSPSKFKESTHSHNPNSPATKPRTSQRKVASRRIHELRNVSLRRRSHVSIRDGQRFSLTKSVKRQPTIARDWSPVRKRLVASVACISTALIGVLVGIYAGLVPSIQYFIADFHHYSIIGNVVLYLGMALSTFFCWPLPLLHGRKPYIVCSLCVAMPLLFPQAIAVSSPRSPYTSFWRWALLLPRALMGFTLGFASMNFHSILTDLFGASLMSSNPHQELVDQYDVRRHGGGLGVWLGIWTWCFIGSLGIGFLVGAVVIDTLRPSWGLYISILLIAVVLILNVLCPEVRRSAWRRSVAEVWTGSTISRRVARGEVMMHRVKDGPMWWGQEMYHGVALSFEMLRQPGFVIMAIYSAWLYAQVVLIIVLLGSLASRYYRYHSPIVGAAVSSVAIGALAAVPFQLANLLSRFRSVGPLTNSMTFEKRVTWTSHLVRRAIFIIVLPIAGIAYTIVSSGPPVHLVFPCLFAAIIGFLSSWDCSDFQPGMTGRSRSGKDGIKRTNYSSFPRVTAGWNIIHSIGFIFAAGATGISGIATRSLGQRAATGVVASILFMQSLLLLAVFFRFKRVQIIPNSKSFEMDKWTEERRDSLRRRASALAAAKANGVKDRPVMLGNPSEKFRRMNILELGSMTRWSEIRKKNRLIDEGARLNRQAVRLARDELGRGAGMLGEVRSHDSDQGDNHPRIELRDMSPRGPPGAGLDHQHPPLPGDVYLQRECVMGQTVLEEAEDLSSTDGDLIDEHGPDDMQGHSSHMTSKVQPYTGYREQALKSGETGIGDYVIDMAASQGEHYSHAEPKIRPADPEGSKRREQHGAHMESKVKPANTEAGNLAQEHGAHMHESKVQPATSEFEDVDLSGKSDRKGAKARKQD